MALVAVNESAGGDFLPIVKYDSRAGRIFRVDRADGISTPVDITRSFKALFDFEQVEVGYILFSAGGAPVFNMVPFGTAMPARPQGEFKQGVRLHIKLAKECGGDVRELAGTANAFLHGINAVHDEYLKAAPANPGKLPVVALHDAEPIESSRGAKKSTNYRPVFAIVGWAPRPADMPALSLSNGPLNVHDAFNGNATTMDAPPLPPRPSNGAAGQRYAGPMTSDRYLDEVVQPAAVSANDANRAANLEDFG